MQVLILTSLSLCPSLILFVFLPLSPSSLQQHDGCWEICQLLLPGEPREAFLAIRPRPLIREIAKHLASNNPLHWAPWGGQEEGRAAVRASFHLLAKGPRPTAGRAAGEEKVLGTVVGYRPQKSLPACHISKTTGPAGPQPGH